MNRNFVDSITHYKILNDLIILLKHYILYRLKYNKCVCPIVIQISIMQSD